MPLVTLTCDPDFYPPDELNEESVLVMSSAQMLVYALARSFPERMICLKQELRLDEDTPMSAVQVDIQKFHISAVNAPNVWVKIEFTEQQSVLGDRLAVRNVLLEMLEEVFNSHIGSKSPVSWALDVSWGPSHGGLYTQVFHPIKW